MKCPVCSTESEGRFCPECGAGLKDVRCSACKTPLIAGARYCTQCGHAAYSGPARLPWIVAGVALTALAAVLIVQAVGGNDAAADLMPPGGASQAPPLAGEGGMPELSADPRENADRLFNRIMTERANGNLQQAEFFLPMAIQAYGLAEPLDDDGIFHLSLLQGASGQFDDAQRSAERILENNPQHLLALGAAAEAVLAAGDTTAARAYYRRLLDAYDAEKEKVYPEYVDHAGIMPQYQEQARALIGNVP
ncbi:MAG: double zinc ribbon domain-containing protein [Longimicrobiales bacterium]